MFGSVEVNRLAYRAAGVDSLHPLDAELNLPVESYSFGVRRLAAVEAAKGSFDETVASLKRETGTPVPKRQTGQLVTRAAQDFDAFYGQREFVDAEKSAPILVISSDGKGVVMRVADLREATRKAALQRRRKLGKRLTKGEKKNAKRMATVAAVYTVAPYPRTPEEIARTLVGSSEPGDLAHPRPRPENKRVWASLEKPADEVIEGAFAEAETRDVDHQKTWVGLVDGNKDQLAILHQLAKARGLHLTIILDIIHVCEYLWKASLCFHAEGALARELWVEERLLCILRGKSSQVAAGIRRSATRRGLAKKARKPVDRCATYLLNNSAYLHYDRYLAAGLPISTGVIEGACRYLVKDRMDITGARWSLKGAEAVLRLRALRASGDFEEYWRFHEQREYERNHASRYADGKVVPVRGRHLSLAK